MRRWMIFFAAVVIAALLPSGGTELGGLRPAYVLWIGRTGNEIFAETDLGDRGRGPNLESALWVMRKTAPGEVFLETVQYLLMEEETKEMLPELRTHLRPTVRLCTVEGEQNLKEAAQYLKVWKPEGTMEDPSWQRLQRNGERYYLEE